MPGADAWVPPAAPDANTFRIFISTDNHLGFAEKHDYPPRQDDSFLAVEEVLENATASQVWFLHAPRVLPISCPLFHALQFEFASCKPGMRRRGDRRVASVQQRANRSFGVILSRLSFSQGGCCMLWYGLRASKVTQSFNRQTSCCSAATYSTTTSRQDNAWSSP